MIMSFIRIIQMMSLNSAGLKGTIFSKINWTKLCNQIKTVTL